MPERSFHDLPLDLLSIILAFIPCLKARLRLATVAKQWLAALASSDSYSHDAYGHLPVWGVPEIEARPDPPMLQQDVLAALAASGIMFRLHEGCTSCAWLPPTVRSLSLEGCLPADCPVLACVEVLLVESAPHCTTLDVTRFPNARVLKAFFERLDEQELQTIPWLGQLVALPQLTRVALDWGGINPGRFSIQLPAGCELEIETWCGQTLSESLPPSASRAHLVTLKVVVCDVIIDFSCLATCPRLRHVKLNALCMDNVLDGIDLSTLNHVPDRCSVELIFQDAAMHIASFRPPAGWSVDVAPGNRLSWSRKQLTFSRIGSQNCTVDVNP